MNGLFLIFLGQLNFFLKLEGYQIACPRFSGLVATIAMLFEKGCCLFSVGLLVECFAVVFFFWGVCPCSLVDHVTKNQRRVVPTSDSAKHRASCRDRSAFFAAYTQLA